MKFNFVDMLAAAFVLLGMWRGRKRGIHRELFPAVSICVAFVFGCGIYRMMGGALSRLDHAASSVTGG